MTDNTNKIPDSEELNIDQLENVSGGAYNNAASQQYGGKKITTVKPPFGGKDSNKLKLKNCEVCGFPNELPCSNCVSCGAPIQ